MRISMMLTALLIVSTVCIADDVKGKLEKLDKLWDEEKTDREWDDIYFKQTEDWGDYAEHIGNKCPITIMMSGTDPGLDCMIKHKLAEGMSSGFYGVDMEVSIGGNNDRKGILEGKTLYKDLGPKHATPKTRDRFGMKGVPDRPPVKSLWPEKYPTQTFDRVRYALTFDKDTIRKLIENHLYFFGISNDYVPKKMRAIMAEVMGPYFLRSRVSEGQAAYFKTIGKLKTRPINRKQAYNAIQEYHARESAKNRQYRALKAEGVDDKEAKKQAADWLAKTVADGELKCGNIPTNIRYCPVSSSSVILNNVMATEGKGIIKRFDPEVAWDSPQILSAMHNGLARALGVDWTAYYATESTSKWGPGKRPVIPDTPYEGLFRFTYWHGDRPLNLIERSLYTYWLEGIDLLLIADGAHLIFKKGPDENTFLPSDFGLKIKRLNDLSMEKTGFDRGDVYRPAALMFDRYTNWQPLGPIDAHTWDPPGPYRRKIMGVEAYKKKDYMIDNFFGAVFPGYEWSAAWGTPKDLVNAPYGDSFEVIYDSVDTRVLAFYPSCFVLGEPEMTDELKKKLMDYVKNGGDLVLNIMQVDEELLKFCGVKADWHVNRWYKQLGELRVADASKNLVTDQVYVEDRYHYNRVFPEKGTEILAETAGNPEFAGDLDAGWPLVTRKKQGKGNVYLVTVQYMQNCSCLNFPYGLLNVCRDLIGIVLDPHQIVKIDGAPIQYIVNTKKDGGLVVSLINNARTEWSGKAIVRNAAKLKKVKEWYEDKVPEIGVDGKDAVIETVLKPGDIRIYSFN